MNGRSSPTPVPGLSGVTSIGTGESHTCAVLSDTTVRCWGMNLEGGLGDGTLTDSPVPVPVRLGPPPTGSGGSAGGGGAGGGSGGAAGGGVGGAGGTYGPNLVPNGDFSDGMNGWQTTNTANGFGQVSNGTFCFSYGDGGYGTVGTTGPLYLTGGATYEFSFTAWTTVPVDDLPMMHAKVGEAGPPYDEYTGLSPTLTSTPTTFSQSFAPLANVTAGVAFITTDPYYHGDICVDDVVVRVTQ
jgi:hypothetical protein